MKSLLFEKFFHHFREFVERIREAGRVGSAAISKARIIGCDDVEPAGERRDQFPILMGRSRPTMQQNQLRISGSPASL